MRSFGQLFLAGVAGVMGIKILGALFIPLLAMMMGLLGVALKLAIFGAVVWFIFSLLKRRREPATH
jgi:hypothetical protein